MGAPIALDSSGARDDKFLAQIRQRIKERWDYPCVPNTATGVCEYREASVVVEFGILKSGRLQYVEVRHSSGHAIYVDAAVMAIRRASPYPPVPAALVKAGSTGVPLTVRFTYMVQGAGARAARRAPASLAAAQTSSLLRSLLLVEIALLAALCAWVLWCWRASQAPAPPAAVEAAAIPVRPAPPAPPQPVRVDIAHAALRAHGWRYEGETSGVHSYSHPDLAGHRVNVSLQGEWEHTTTRGVPARGATPQHLRRHLGAIHGTLSIADLQLPGRRDD